MEIRQGNHNRAGLMSRLTLGAKSRKESNSCISLEIRQGNHNRAGLMSRLTLGAKSRKESNSCISQFCYGSFIFP
jgi:hypothetical protein